MPRDILSDRYGVRAAVLVRGVPIKLEFIKFDGYKFIAGLDPDLFPIPYIDRISCFYTKLLSNANRYNNSNGLKDTVDILAMSKEWGGIPK